MHFNGSEFQKNYFKNNIFYVLGMKNVEIQLELTFNA